MVKRRSQREATPDVGETRSGSFHNPFAELRDKLSLPSSTPEESPAASSAEAPAPEPSLPPAARPVIRLERKGHGGKDVTRVTRLARSPEEARRLLPILKQRLGCGGVVEECDILLQGDQRERLEGFLSLLPDR